MIIGMVTKPGPVRRRTPDSRHRTRPRRDSRHATIPPKVSFRSAATWSSANLLSQVKGHFRYFDTVSGHSGPRIQAKRRLVSGPSVDRPKTVGCKCSGKQFRHRPRRWLSRYGGGSAVGDPQVGTVKRDTTRE